MSQLLDGYFEDWREGDVCFFIFAVDENGQFLPLHRSIFENERSFDVFIHNKRWRNSKQIRKRIVDYARSSRPQFIYVTQIAFTITADNYYFFDLVFHEFSNGDVSERTLSRVHYIPLFKKREKVEIKFDEKKDKLDKFIEELDVNEIKSKAVEFEEEIINAIFASDID